MDIQRRKPTKGNWSLKQDSKEQTPKINRES
jgi:hypothetical protein